MTRTLAATATAAALALALAACSDDSDSSPTDPTSGSGSSDSSTSQPAAAPKDRSDAVFSSYQKSDVLGSTSGTVRMGQFSTTPHEVDFEVTGVIAKSDATLLRYQLTAKDGDAQFYLRGEHWYDQPTLQVPGSDTKLQTVTGTVPEVWSRDAEERCVCTSTADAGPDPRSQTTLYPPLPEDATEVEITLPGLDPITVPVTR